MIHISIFGAFSVEKKCALYTGKYDSRNLHKKRSEVSVKTRSTPASLSFKSQAAKQLTVKNYGLF